MKKLIIIIIAMLVLTFPLNSWAVLNVYSLEFEDDSDSLTITDANQTGLDFVGDFTVMYWTKVAAGNNGHIINKGTWDVNGWFTTNSAGDCARVHFWDGNGGNDDRTTIGGTSTCETAGVWKSVAWACDVSVPSCALYVAGSSVGSQVVSGLNYATTIVDDGDSVEFNWRGAATTEEAGTHDAVRVFNTLKDSTYIGNNYNKMCDDLTDTTGLVACWDFENNALDYTGNDNDWTLNNTPTYVTDPAFPGSSPAATEAPPIKIPPQIIIY